MLSLDDVADEPAGRLHTVLSLFHNLDLGGSGTYLSDWWERVAGRVATGGNALTVRSETAALYRDVELAVLSLPRHTKQQSLLASSHLWAKPIFGVELNDAPNQRYPAGSLVPQQALDALNSVSYVLSVTAPELRHKKDADASVEDTLSEVYDMVGQLRLDVIAADDVPEPVQQRILQQLTTILDRITYVRIRGFTGLYLGAQLTQHMVENLAAEPVAQMQHVRFTDRLTSWGERIGGCVSMLEQLLMPAAAGTLAYIASADPSMALGAYIGARGVLGTGSFGQQQALNPGGGDENPPSEGA